MNQPRLTRRTFLYRAAWPVLLMGTIMWASGSRGPTVPGFFVFPHFDKVAHFFVFGLVATLIYRAILQWPVFRKAALFAVVATAFFGGVDEFRQSLNPHRQMDLVDWLVDTAGASVAVAAYTIWPFYRKLLELSVNPFRKKRNGGQRRS